jgi:hypothetical protein
MLGLELVDWLLTFAKSAGEKPGCFPDPYLHAKGKFHPELFLMVPIAIAHDRVFLPIAGDKLWPAWSANDFYGYDEEDKRISLANRPT